MNGHRAIGNRAKLLFLITRSEHGGAQAHVLELITNLRDDFDIEVATGEEGFLIDACKTAGIRTHVIAGLVRDIRPIADLRAFLAILRLFKLVDPDLIHAHTWKSGFLGRLAAMCCGIPVIYTVHMWPFGRGVPRIWSIFGPSLERLAARWSDRLITVSASAAETAQVFRIAPSHDIVAIENGIADCRERADLTVNRFPRVAMVARFTDFKDHQTLIRAFALIGSSAKLLLVGDGPTLRSAERLACMLGLQARVEFTGKRNDIPLVLASADVFVLASKNELMPISILEALRAGLPVIASRVGGIPEVIENGVTGLLVESGSVTEMASALTTLIEDREIRLRLGRAGRILYERRFNNQLMLARTRSVYVDVLAERGWAHDSETDLAPMKTRSV